MFKITPHRKMRVLGQGTLSHQLYFLQSLFIRTEITNTISLAVSEPNDSAWR
jgi:hypothetical protein